MRAAIAILEALGAERGRLLPWAPVCLSLGIGTYFALRYEPGIETTGPAFLLVVIASLAGRRGPELLRAPATGLALVAAGLLLGAVRAHIVAAPVMPFRYYGPVEGRIVAIDRSFSDQLRLTLDRVVLADMAPQNTPARVRVALHGQQGFVDAQPGLTAILTAHLSPPEGPVEPGGFDFQRLAWFSRLGAVGYTRAPVLALEPPDGALALAAFRLRMRISTAMRAQMEGQAGAFAAALMTGDRSGVDSATNDALRASNLSHLISISGLHMGLLTGFVFGAVRYGLALAPPLALRLNTKKIAAVVALIAAAIYLALAGPSVATRRAFIMAAVMLFAVLVDRRAISLRSVAIAALIVLVLEPESLVEPGFQMSFGATVALIMAFQPWASVQRHVPSLLRPVAMLVLSSAAAGFATAPIAAAHFNRIAEYGLVANFFAVPVMGTLVMPMGVIAGLLAPLGLAAPALWLMEQGTAFILMVAAWVAGLEGSVFAVPTPPWFVLPVLSFGGLLALVTRAFWLRGLGTGMVAVALLFWVGAERPVLLVAGDGGLIGLSTPLGRVLSKPKGSGFVAKSWLEDDGDMAPQEAAHARAGLSGEKGAILAKLGQLQAWHFTGKGAEAGVDAACREGAVVILSARWQGEPKDDCLIIDEKMLRQTGALAMHIDKGKLRIVTAREIAGDRLWNRHHRKAQDGRKASVK